MRIVLQGLAPAALIAAAALVAAGRSTADDRCLAGTSLLHDRRDLAALRAAVDVACPCAAYTGGPGADRAAYRACARAVRDTALARSVLRAACAKTAARAAADTTCGAAGRVACGRVTPRARRPATCRITTPARCRSRPRYTEQACPGETHCTDVLEQTGGTCVAQPAYAASWSAVHADGGNTDYSPVAGGRSLALRWQRRLDGGINLGPTVDPAGRVYVTDASNDRGCHLSVLDGATGETIWCSAVVDRFAVASSPLLDREGRIVLADGTAMRAFDPDGRVLWETPIVGVPLSAQLTPSGRVIFVTHVGVLYVLARETGAHVVPPVELVAGAAWTPADGMAACLQGTAGCPSANTLAVDQATGRFFFTFWTPGAPQAELRAMQYAEDPVPTVTPLWTNATLPGGSASSPDLSADGSRIYVNDNVDSVHAVDAATGTTLWSFRIGFAPGGSPSTSPAGIVMPSGSATGPLMALIDRGAAAELLWRHDAMPNRGVPTQAAGGVSYAVVGAGGFLNDLVVVDAATGAELDRHPLPGTTVFTVGTTVGPDGTVYVPTILGQLFAFAPARAASPEGPPVGEGNGRDRRAAAPGPRPRRQNDLIRIP